MLSVECTDPFVINSVRKATIRDKQIDDRFESASRQSVKLENNQYFDNNLDFN